MSENEAELPAGLGSLVNATGSGVADLEMMREQDALASGDVEQIIPPEQAPMDGAAGGPQADTADHLPGVTASGAE